MDEFDKNNNSPMKQDISKIETADQLRPSIETPPEPTFVQKPEKPVLNWETNWSLNLAIPPPDNFIGENHPFLTEFEQQNLRRQKVHLLEELHHLSSVSRPAPPPPANLFDDPKSCSIPALDMSSPVVNQFKGFSGELIGLLKQQDHPSPTSNHSNKSSTENSPLVKPRNGMSTKHCRNGRNGFHKADSPGTVVNGAKVLNSVFKPINSRNGYKDSQELELPKNGTRKGSLKKLKALNKCLKNLAPTCGFQFPVLDQDHPAVNDTVNEPIAASIPGLNKKSDKDSVADSSRNSRKRGLKRRHSCVSQNSPSVQSSKDSEVKETVRRSHRSRKNVERFEATLDNSFYGLARALAVSAADSGLGAHYDVLSLRTRPDGRVDYLVSWAR